MNASLVSEADSEDASRRSLIPLRVFIPSSTSGGSIQHLIQAKVKQMATVTSTETGSVLIMFYRLDWRVSNCLIKCTDEPAASAPAMLTIKETLEKLPGLVAVLPADTNRWEILCQGISIPLDAPLSLIARDLCMPDNFLNLVVASNREAQENVS